MYLHLQKKKKKFNWVFLLLESAFETKNKLTQIFHINPYRR